MKRSQALPVWAVWAMVICVPAALGCSTKPDAVGELDAAIAVDATTASPRSTASDRFSGQCWIEGGNLSCVAPTPNREVLQLVSDGSAAAVVNGREVTWLDSEGHLFHAEFRLGEFVAAEIPGVTGIALTSGDLHRCVLTPEGSPLCWGDGTWGALGPIPLGEFNLVNVPTAIFEGPVLEVVAGGHSTCVRDLEQKVWCAGSVSEFASKNEFREFPRLAETGTLFGGGDEPISRFCATGPDGEASCIVEALGGEPGLQPPSTVDGASGFGIAATAGCGILADNSIRCWPFFEGDPAPTEDRAFEVMQGLCGYTVERQVWCWNDRELAWDRIDL